MINCYVDKHLYDYGDNIMPTPLSNNLTRWTVSVPKETDTSLRCFLAERGMKKGDISKFIVDAVKWRVFEQTTNEIREKFADVLPEELQNIVNEAIESVRLEMREELRNEAKC
jgi:3-oxoacyl-[acyl-carrier-protein] synthase III